MLKNIYHFSYNVAKKQCLTVFSKRYVYKLAWSFGKQRLENEFKSINTLSQLFAKKAHFYLPLYKNTIFCVGRSKILKAGENRDLSDEVISSLLFEVPTDIEYREWQTTFNNSAIQLIFENLSRTSKNYIKTCLSGVMLPVTGSHGDLIQQNFLVESNTVKIIDWEFYYENGSIVNDVLRYHMMRRSNFNGISFLSPESLRAEVLPDSLNRLIKFNSRCTRERQLQLLGVIGNGTSFWNDKHGTDLAKKIDSFIKDYIPKEDNLPNS